MTCTRRALIAAVSVLAHALSVLAADAVPVQLNCDTDGQILKASSRDGYILGGTNQTESSNPHTISVCTWLVGDAAQHQQLPVLSNVIADGDPSASALLIYGASGLRVWFMSVTGYSCCQVFRSRHW